MDANAATEIVSKVNDWVEVAGLIVMALVVVSTVLVKLAGFIVKFTKSTDDDAKVAAAQDFIHRMANAILETMVIFPTLGKNPRTKMLEKNLRALEQKSETVVTVNVNGSIEDSRDHVTPKAD